MTREEARDQIVIFMDDEHEVINDRDRQALEIAIKVLEQNSKYRKEAKRWKNKALEQRWIPISKKMPKKKGSYLLCLDNDYISTAYYDGNQWYVGSEKERIVAWMPLPKPYKEEREDKE